MNPQKFKDEIKRRIYIIQKISPNIITQLSLNQHNKFRGVELTELIGVRNEALNRE